MRKYVFNSFSAEMTYVNDLATLSVLKIIIRNRDTLKHFLVAYSTEYNYIIKANNPLNNILSYFTNAY